MKKVLTYSFLFALVDQIVKNIIVFNMNFNDELAIIKNFFTINLVGNSGAAFSILKNATLFLILVSIIAINVIYFLFIYNKQINKKEQLLYGALIGGIIGNLVDRVFYGYVIDYLSFELFKYNFPIFNLADIFIVISVIIILWLSIRSEIHEHHK